MALPFNTAFPGTPNVYIPTFAGSGKQQSDLIVSYARDPKKFAINKLVQRFPVKNMNGNWIFLAPSALARVISDPNAVVWVDGQPFPKGTHNAQDFKAIPYACVRRGHPDTLGYQTRDQAVWPIESTKLGVLAHLMMTQRAVAFYNVALTAANYLLGSTPSTAGSHVGTANYWSGLNGTPGFWSAGTSANPIIKRSILNAANQIRIDTLAAVDFHQLTLVISPTAAIAMGSSQEINDVMARSPWTLANVRGDSEPQNGMWSLPDRLYGVKLVVDPTLRTTSPRLQQPGSFTDIMDDNTAILMAEPGSLGDNVGQVGSSFSSFGMFVYDGEEMVVKSRDDTWNQRIEFQVYETYGINMVASETAALITNLFS